MKISGLRKKIQSSKKLILEQHANSANSWMKKKKEKKLLIMVDFEWKQNYTIGISFPARVCLKLFAVFHFAVVKFDTG